MAEINQVITLGIGTPGDIEHFILMGLSASEADYEPGLDLVAVVPYESWVAIVPAGEQ